MNSSPKPFRRWRNPKIDARSLSALGFREVPASARLRLFRRGVAARRRIKDESADANPKANDRGRDAAPEHAATFKAQSKPDKRPPDPDPDPASDPESNRLWRV